MKRLGLGASLSLAMLLGSAATGQKSPAAPDLARTVDHLKQGHELAKSKKWPEAERELRIACQQHPNSTEACVGHAEALSQIGQPFDAELELQNFLRDHPNSARAHEFFAVLAYGTKGDYLKAETELETAVKLDPNSAQAWHSLGDLYIDRSMTDDAVRAFQHALALRPQDAVIRASLADAYGKAGDEKRAKAEFAEAIKMTQGASNSLQAATVRYAYAKFLLDQGQTGESIVASNKALEYNPRSAIALTQRARAYIALRDYGRAEADALQALELAPNEKGVPLLLTDIYRKQHDMEKAQKYAEITQKLVDEEEHRASFARDIRRLLDVAEGALRKGQFAEAISPYEELLTKVPTFYEAYFGVGMCYSQTGRLQDAETAFRKYLSYQPISADGHAALGVLLLQQGRGAEAVPELQQALEIDPSLDEARKALATQYVNESKPKEALRVLRAAKSSKDTQLIVMLASLLSQQGDRAGALQEVRRALAIQPNDPDAMKLNRALLATNSTGK